MKTVINLTVFWGKIIKIEWRRRKNRMGLNLLKFTQKLSQIILII